MRPVRAPPDSFAEMKFASAIFADRQTTPGFVDTALSKRCGQEGKVRG